MKGKNLVWQLPLLVVLVLGTVLIVRHDRNMPYQHDEGMVFGTFYHITYQSDRNYKKDIEAALKAVDCSLSPFNDSSVISRVNRNEAVETDDMFIDVFTLAQRISEDTDGAFDITVAPLVNAWGFGFRKGMMPDGKAVDSLKAIVGMDKVRMKGRTVIKSDARVMLDCSAIAKGYASDVIARLLKDKEVRNFMVEIGGEVVTKGVNERRENWRIGINRPEEDSLGTDHELQTVLHISDKAMATSGNYRNFYYRDGKKYAHTIDPVTGLPVEHSLLSATVVARTCAIADAYATAFMVMGIDKAKQLLARHADLQAYLIYTAEDGTMQVWQSPKLKTD